MTATRVLLSGGMDSTLCLVLALAENPDASAVACDYGQRHRRELGQAVLIAQVLSTPLHIARGLDIGSGRLTGEAGELDAQGVVLPGRNKALLRAAAWVRNVRADEVWIGATADDQEVFEDCRRSYFDELEKQWGVRIRSPLVDKTKADIVRMYHERGASSLLVYTHSCYRGEQLACGYCGACKARTRGFYVAGMRDPGAYADRRYLAPCGFCAAGPGQRCHHPNHGYVAPHRQRLEG